MKDDDAARSRFQALLDRHRGIVLKVAYSYCWNAADRADLAQEICAQLWRSFGHYDEGCKFSTWMYRIALNVAISQVRGTGRKPPMLPIEAEEAILVIAPVAPEPDERITMLERFIAALDPFSRALVLLYLEERSYREIADVLGITETNVATKINRLKQRMRQELAPALAN